jgi:small subunit ribosomal protein S6e
MKVVISMKGKSFQKEVDDNIFYGKKIGDKIEGSVVGLDKFEIQITGGSDKQGFPMRKGVHGTIRKKLLLSGGVGYKPKRKGVKRRKSIRGETISEEIAQLNLKILKEGERKFDEILKEVKGEEIKDISPEGGSNQEEGKNQDKHKEEKSDEKK